LQTPDQINGITSKVDYQFAVVATQSESGTSGLTKSSLFASPADVTASNGSNDLTIGVVSQQIISGTVTFSAPLVAQTKVTVELYKVNADNTVTLVAIDDPIATAPPVGSTSVGFTISQETGRTVSGISEGTYKVKVSAHQYGSVWIDSVVMTTNAKVTGLFANLTVDAIQSIASFSPVANLGAGVTQDVTLTFNSKLNAGANTIDALKFRFLAATGATGDFANVTVKSFSIDGVDAGLTNVTNDGTYNVVNTAAFGATNNSIELVLTIETGATQDGLFTLDSIFISGTSTFTALSASGLAFTDATAYFSVGAPVTFLTSTLPGALLGQQYQQSIRMFPELPSDHFVFSETGLTEAAMGVTLNSSGVLSGSPTKSSKTGFPFTVTVDYTLPYDVLDANGVSTNAGTISKDFLLQVFKEGFAIYSIEPAAVPTTGGEVVVRGIGFESGSILSVSASDVQSTYINQNTMVMQVPAMSTGTYDVAVQANSASEDYAFIPNPVNSQSLVVAVSEVSSVEAGVTVTGDQATVLDYEIVGLKSFYQGNIKDILVSAFGPYDVSQWRAFGYQDTYYEVGDMTAADTDKLRAGSGFWRISKVAGTVSSEGVSVAATESYTVAVPARSWALVVNMYEGDIVWQDVEVLAGKADAPVVTTVGSVDNTYVNQTLWGMDQSAADLTKPYKVEAVMSSGKGYWVYNKSLDGIAVKINKPTTTTQTKAKSAVAIYKPEESTPPEAPVSVQESGISAPGAAAGGGGGGCFLK
jgi:hypothetical protein